MKSSRTCRGQMLEAEVEDNTSRPRTKFWPRGQLVLEDLTSLVICGLGKLSWPRPQMFDLV